MGISSDNLVFLLAGGGLGLPAGYLLRLLIERWQRRLNDRHFRYFRGEWKREARLFLIMASAGIAAALAIALFTENAPTVYHDLKRSAARSIIEEKTGKAFSDAEIDKMIREFRERGGEETADRLIREYVDTKDPRQ